MKRNKPSLLNASKGCPNSAEKQREKEKKKMLEVQYLNPVFNKQESFYKKALVIYSYGEVVTTIKLYSYEAHVATIQIEDDDDEGHKTTLYITHNKYYLTNTTIKHIKEFCLQYGFNYTNIKDMLKYHEDII